MVHNPPNDSHMRTTPHREDRPQRSRDMIRLTITRKIACAVVGMVVLSVGTMVWLTGQNLQSGFLNYLNASQVRDLEELRDLLAGSYREQGTLAWLRDDPRAMRELKEGRRPPPRPMNIRRPPSGYGRPQINDRPPPRIAGPGDGSRPLPEFESPGDDRPPPPDDNRPPPQMRQAGPPDPYGFGPRLSILDERGQPLLGPPNPTAGTVRMIEVDGRVVGKLVLAPLRGIASATDQRFVRDQVRDMLLMAVALVILSAMLAILLARHLLRPVAALREVAGQIAQGKLDARAPVIGHDELAELARHVNEMAQSLEASEQQRRRMLADVSHELRTPLAVIRGEIEAMQDGVRRADPASLASLHEEVLRLNKLIDDLHQLALADAGGLHIESRCIELDELVQSLIKRYRTRMEAAGLAMSVTLAPATVQGDPNRLAQVIANLLENSLRYTDKGGTIAVSLAVRDCIELCIEDSAPGVPEGMHERLFERLYRADAARSRARGGSGLGLAICKALVEAQGGSISAMPSALGGVKMLVRLPAGEQDSRGG
jgi:two-component system sensor histidine kinase BaeS